MSKYTPEVTMHDFQTTLYLFHHYQLTFATANDLYLGCTKCLLKWKSKISKAFGVEI